MSRSPFSRSPRHSTNPSVPHAHSSSSSIGRSHTASPSMDEGRRSSSLSVQMRGMRRLEQRRNMEELHYLDSKARALNLNPPVDLRMLDFVTPYDDNLMCPICRCPFVDPVVLAECDHCFCRDCIRQTWNTHANYTPLGPKGVCPTCRTPAKLGPRSATSKILVNIVDDLLVKCPKHDEGCKTEVKRGEVQDHVNIYCAYTLIQCPAKDCEYPVRRKDAGEGCLHYGVSCSSCRAELQQWKLESHWRSECPERKAYCELCKSSVYCRDLDEHTKQTCPAISIACPGKAFGCTSRSQKAQAEIHAKACTFAKLAPILTKQQQRLDEQEAAQKEMSRKLEILESGFSAMQSILYPSRSPSIENPDRASADVSSIPLLQGHERLDSTATAESSDSAPGAEAFQFPAPPSSAGLASSPATPIVTIGAPPSRPAPTPPGPRPSDLPAPYSSDFDLAPPDAFPPPSINGGPYASPLHHLLSMHESMRDEMSRVSSALSELDGRHSMQMLNENLRTREEISYFGAQLAGLQRQVHWLTSAQLQRQQARSVTPGSSSSAVADAGAGAGVEAAVSAVNTAATALRGAARVVNVSRDGGMGMRRGPSEEGRTKL